MSKKKKNKSAKAVHITEKDTEGTEKEQAAFPEDTPENKEVHTREKLSGTPESIAEDLAEAISDAKERGEERSKNSSKREMMSLRNVLIAITFGIVLFWALHHTGSILHFLGSVLDVFSPILIGGCIAFVLNLVLIPLESFWKKCFGRIKNPKICTIISRAKRPFCLILSTVIMLGLVCGLFFIAIPEITSTVKTFIDKAPEFLKKAEATFMELQGFLAKYHITLPEWKLDANTVIAFLESLVTERGQQMLNTTVGFTTSLFSVVFDAVLSTVVAFYLLAQKEKLSIKIKKILYAVMNEQKADTIISVAALSNNAFTKFVTGQFTEAIIIGVLCYVGMLIFRMPYAVVISVIIGATALIPIFGAFVGAAIGAVLILSNSFMQAVWFIVFIVILQQIETNLIYPRVVGKSIGLPGLLVLSAVTVGGAVFGFSGIILGVPICSVIYCIFNEFVALRIRNKGEHIEKKTGRSI